MCATVRASARVLVHETLTVLATDLRTLLGGHWHLRCLRRSISGHRLTIAWTHRHPVARIGIVPWRWPITTVALLDWVSARLRHVARHRLWHTTRRDERDLCLTTHMRAAFTFDDGFETVLDSGSASGSSAWWNADAERESLGWTLAEIAWAGDLNISGVENVLDAVHFLNALVVDGYPDGLFETLEDPSFKLDTVRLNILVRVNVDLSDDWLSLLESSLVKGDPDFALWGNEMIEQAHNRVPAYLVIEFPRPTYEESVTLTMPR